LFCQIGCVFETYVIVAWEFFEMLLVFHFDGNQCVVVRSWRCEHVWKLFFVENNRSTGTRFHGMLILSTCCIWNVQLFFYWKAAWQTSLIWNSCVFIFSDMDAKKKEKKNNTMLTMRRSKARNGDFFDVKKQLHMQVFIRNVIVVRLWFRRSFFLLWYAVKGFRKNMYGNFFDCLRIFFHLKGWVLFVLSNRMCVWNVCYRWLRIFWDVVGFSFRWKSMCSR
jgi:hypothetical protein